MADDRKAEISSFAALLQALDEGSVSAELSVEAKRVVRELSELADATNSTRKGSLTLTLSLVARPNATVDVHAEVKTKTPKAPRAGSTFWATAGGALSAANPKQPRLPIRDIEPAPVAAPIPVEFQPPARTL